MARYDGGALEHREGSRYDYRMGWIRKITQGAAGGLASAVAGAAARSTGMDQWVFAQLQAGAASVMGHALDQWLAGLITILLIVSLLALVFVVGWAATGSLFEFLQRHARGRKRLIWLLEDTADAINALAFRTSAYRIDSYYGQYADATTDFLQRKIKAQCADITRLQNKHCDEADRLSGNASPSEMLHLAERLRLHLEGRL